MSHSLNENVNILLLDDEVDFLNLTKSYLTKISNNKFQIDFISDPKELVSQLEILENYDILVSDYEMTEINGLEVLTEVRNRFDNFPFILFTGKGREEVAIEALNLGANYYITKGFDVDSQFRELVHAIQMLVNQKQTERALQESESKYHSLIDNIPAVSWVSDKSGRTTFISPNIEQVYGFSQQEILEGGEKLWFGRIHPDDLERVKTHYQLSFQNKGKFNIEYRIKRKDNKWIWIHDKSSNLLQEAKKFVAYGVFTDITKQKQITFQNQAMLNVIPDMFFRIDKKTKILSFRGDTNSLYLPPEEFLGKTCFEVLPENVANLFKDNITKVLITDEIVIEFEYSLILQDGEHTYEARMVKSGFEEALAIVRDITDQNRNKKALIENEIRYRSLFEQTPMAQSERDYSDVKTQLNDLKSSGIEDLRVYLEDNPEEVFNIAKKVKLIDVNQAALDLYKVATKKEFSSLGYDYLTDHPQTMDSFINLLVAIDQNNASHSFISKVKIDSGKIQVINVILLVPEGFKNSYERVWSKYIDITELKEAENTLTENELKYKTIFDLTDDAIVILDREKIIDCNKASVRLFGFKDKTELVGLRLIDFSPKFQPDGQSSFTKFVEKIGSVYFGDQEIFLWRTKRIDNQKEFDSEVKLTKLRIGNKEIILGVIRPYDFKY
jgi:PAS domain S-box-containing protein